MNELEIDDDGLLRDSFKQIIDRFWSPTHAGRPNARGSDFLPLWRMLGEAGYLGVRIPSANGGMELPFRQIGLLLQLIGANLCPGPFTGSAVIGVEWLRLAKAGALLAAREADLFTGKAVICPLIETACRTKKGRDWSVSGRVSPVPYGGHATLFLVEAVDSSGRLNWLAIDARLPGIKLTSVHVMDGTREYVAVEFEDVQVSDHCCLRNDVREADRRRLLAVRDAASAAESAGGARRILEISRQYALDRKQFDRPIGSFQVIKHMLADQVIAVEGAWSAVEAALVQLDEGSHEAETTAAVAKLAATSAYLEAAQVSIQIHGGMGFTAEADVHLYLKRSQLDRCAFGRVTNLYSRLAGNLRELAFGSDVEVEGLAHA